MASSLAPSSQTNAPQSEILEQFRWKDSHLLRVFHIPLPDDSKVQFGFAVYKFSDLERTMNSLCYYVACRFANQGAQNLCDVYGSLQRFPCHAKPIVTFSHFGGAAKSTHLHFAYYLVLEKNKGALERKMNHSLPFQTL